MVDNKELCQNTLKSKVCFSGIGLFTGEKTEVTIHPAHVNHGIVFKRVDLFDKPFILAKLENVKETDRSTSVGLDKKNIQTVEHLLSALYALKIDNALIEVKGPEIPIMDGSSNLFVKLINEVGVQKQDSKNNILQLFEPVYFNERHVHIIALPSDEFRISFAIHHPNCDILKSQYYSFAESDSYVKDIAPSRTFCIYEEIEPLINNNFLKGGSLDNAVIVKDGKIINKEGIRFSNEMVRHKILDMMGDLSLIGQRIKAHIIAVRSGHFTNILFAKKLLNHLKS